jgi:hypothetical protein
LATPVAYSLFDDLAVLLARWFGRAPAEPAVELKRDGHRVSPDGNGNGDTQTRKRSAETVVVRREPAHKEPNEG